VTVLAPATVSRLLAGTRLDGRPLTLVEHRARHGSLSRPGRHDATMLQRALAGAGLRGRGGAGFPAARKLAAAHESGRRGTLIVNASEGEPASRKDRTLLGLSPHLVLDGAQLAARAMRAREVVVAVHAGALSHVVDRALAERDDAVAVRVLEVPHRYVAGEASALARAALGGPALPALHDVPLAVRGPNSRPTVVLNAETLAGLALYLRHGARWYAEVGTPDEPGTVLLTLCTDGLPPAVVEVALGTPVGAVVVTDLQAVLVGGYFGAWLPAPAVLDVPLSHAGLRAAGGTLGAGVVAELSTDVCGLRTTADVVRYLAGQSAKQCGPCLTGLPAMAAALTVLAAGDASTATVDRLAQLCGLVTGRGLCHHPDGTAALVRSALKVFADDVAMHVRGGCGRPASRALAVPR
jgi:NADH:ubiquinone oxidoreductase subunit F (NADH-binding)